MKIIKKWDVWYWILAVVYMGIEVGNSYISHPGILFSKSPALIAIEIYVVLVLIGVPVLFVYLVLKAVQTIVAKLKIGQDRSKYITLLICVIIFAGVIGWQGTRLWFGI